MSRVTRSIISLFIFATGVVMFVIAINVAVYIDSLGRMFAPTDDVSAEVVLVLGASAKHNAPSDILEDRLETALELYRTGKVQKLLLSGDNGQEYYDEVNVMREYLLEKDVASEDIFLDHAGFDTYDSVYRASRIFGADDFIIVTQEFHLPRALFIAHHLDIEATGVIADRQRYIDRVRQAVREYIANVKAFFDIILRTKPTYLGDPIDITGDGRVTWDEE